jgi:NADH-quinone oxidoreductase subunit C
VPDAPAAEPAPESAPPPAPALPAWAQAVRRAVPDGVLSLCGVPGGDGEADLPTLQVAPARWRAVAEALCAQGLDFFVDLCGVDHPERPARLEVVLHLRDIDRGLLVRARTEVAEGEALASLEPVFPGAGWPEREVFDLLGVRFAGNSDLRRLMLPDDWQGHPLRRDYPLQGPRASDPDSPYAM